MSKSKSLRLLAVLLAMLMLVPGFGIAVSASSDSGDVDSGSAGDETSFGGLTDVLTTIKYTDYLSQHENAKAGTGKASVDVTDYSKSDTTAEGVEVYDEYKGVKNAILLPSEGTVGWKVNAPSDGYYCVKLQYYAVELENSKATSIERSFYIDGTIPFYEAAYLSMSRTYINEYKINDDGSRTFLEDINGNQIRPDTKKDPQWREYVFTDSTGYHVDPLQFYLTKGEHTIQLYSQRESAIVSSIELYPYEKYVSYEDYINKYTKEGASEVKLDTPITIQAEYTDATSEASIYPTNDRTSSITMPQDPSLQLLNTVGGGMNGEKKWNTVGQWVSYNVTVPEDGFYKIAMRFNQTALEGSFVSRQLRVKLAGDKVATVPFYEASYLQFGYEDQWQNSFLSDGKTEFMIYLKKGINSIELEANLGNMSEIIRRVDDSLRAINDSYIKILMIAGSNPDKNNSYNFYRRIPDSIDTLLYQSKVIYGIADEMEKVTGTTGSRVATLRTVAQLCERMGSNEDQIAGNLGSLKSNLGTLGTWVNDSRESPLEVDYIQICSGDTAKETLPEANANFWQLIAYEFKMFCASFVSDYDTLGQLSEVSEDQSIQVWTSKARDQAQIIRNLINNDFTPESGIAVNLKLVAGGSLLPSVLAGVGPDVSMGHGSSDTINWAIRNALVDLSDLDGWDEILGYKEGTDVDWSKIFKDAKREKNAWFDNSALIPLMLDEVYNVEDIDKSDNSYTYYKDEDGKELAEKYSIWGLPMEQDFMMMFYRADIFLELGLKPPKTWDDLTEIIGLLQNNKMEVAMPTSLGGLEMFLYQMGGDLYADHGQKINLDSNIALSAYETMCSYFQQNKLPIALDFSNRFRSGEVPLGLISYTSYTQLSVYATEIKGLWEFVPLPSYVDKDGNKNNTSVSGVSSIIMLKGAKDDNKINQSWEFMKWFVRADTQSNFATELTSLLGSVTKHNTANVQSLMDLPWTTSEIKNLSAQFENLSAIPEYPGSYIIGRYVDFSFKKVYNDNADPVDTLLENIIYINSELTRKRQEFGLAYKEISYSN